MSYNFDNDRPIYLQIVDIITKQIISEELSIGSKIPSVREYAFIFKANPNTISKALSILEDNKLIVTERTNGKFVTTNLDIIKKHKEEVAFQKINAFVNDIKSLGYSKEEIIKKIMEVRDEFN